MSGQRHTGVAGERTSGGYHCYAVDRGGDGCYAGNGESHHEDPGHPGRRGDRAAGDGTVVFRVLRVRLPGIARDYLFDEFISVRLL